MAEVWTLSEESIRKLAKLVSAQERELSNLRRHLAHYSTRRHEAVYLPSKQVYLAEFKAHSSPDPTYAYPLPTDNTRDVVFPAYLVDGPMFDDTDPFSKTAYPTADGLGEAIFVHSLRRTYIPPKAASGIFLPVFKVSNKWWIDYDWVPRVEFTASTTGSTIAAGTSPNIDDLLAANYEWLDLPGATAYSPIQISSAAVITSHYACTAMVSVSACFQWNSFVGTASAAGFIGTAGTAAPSLTAMHYEFPPLPAGGSYTTGRVTVSATGFVLFDAGETLSFNVQNQSGGGSVTLQSFGVTISPRLAL